jgi:hypothetical protein
MPVHSPAKAIAIVAGVAVLLATGASSQCPLSTVPHAEYDSFGHSLDLNQDTLVVGASQYSGVIPGGGIIHVYHGDATHWNEVATLLPPNALSYEAFGQRLSISRRDILVGSPHKHAVVPNSGVVYVYGSDSTTSTPRAILWPQDPETESGFGYSIDADEDTLVVGAPGKSNLMPGSSGAVYVFKRSGGSWHQQAKLVVESPYVGMNFGVAVSLDRNTLIATSEFENNSTGAVYVFDKQSDGVWHQVQRLQPTELGAGDSFGSSIDIDGNTLVVGASNADPITISSGAAYVFERVGGAWSQTAKLYPSDGHLFGLFGHRMCLSNDEVIGLSWAKLYRWTKSGSLWQPLGPLPGYECNALDFATDSNILAISSACDTSIVFNIYSYLMNGQNPVYLSASSPSLSVLSANSVSLNIQGCAGVSGYPFLILGSYTGTTPGVSLGKCSLPLVPDAFTNYTLVHPNTGPMKKSMGVLSQESSGQGIFESPSGLSPALYGLNVHLAAVLFAHDTGSLNLQTTNAVTVKILP